MLISAGYDYFGLARYVLFFFLYDFGRWDLMPDSDACFYILLK
jgi:hypothetical protein